VFAGREIMVLLSIGAHGTKRPDSSVVEHFHGKEGVASSILARGSDAFHPRGGVAQLVRAHGS